MQISKLIITSIITAATVEAANSSSSSTADSGGVLGMKQEAGAGLFGAGVAIAGAAALLL